MQANPNNHIVALCAQGMDMEAKGESIAAYNLFLQAWNEAANDFEKFISAHYVARHQNSVEEKLKWDETALQLAFKINNEDVTGAYPSLYLNIAKDYEDLKDFDKANKNYQLALSFTDKLSDNGYGNMIKGGILNGMERLKQADSGSNK